MLIYSRPITVAHHANRVSCASCCSACYLVLLLVLPYVVAIAMGAFWTKDAFNREQPSVYFRHEAMVEAYLADGTALGWSTSDQFNTALGSRLRPCQLRAWPEDNDRDGKPESLEFLLTVPLDADGGERLHGLTVLLGAGAAYNSASTLQLNGSLLVQHQSGLSGARWRQHADVGLRTESPLRPSSMESRAPCGAPFWLLQQPLGLDGQPTTAEAEVDRYDACNDTLTLAVRPPLWTPGVASSFELRLTLHVPSADIPYQPGALEQLKLGWVQYLALLLPIYWLLSTARGLAIRHGVLTTRVHDPLRPAKSKTF